MNDRAQALRRITGLVLILTAAPGIAWAHEQTGVASGFVSGFLHPALGLDHVIAMAAVGLWGAPAVWMLPINFPLIMAAGGMLGALGVPLPFVEIGIAVSGIALGVLVALATRAPLWAAMLLVGVFAVFHGHAHGTELPEAANPLAYGAGFVLMTGLLHLSGIAFGLLYERPLGARAVRVCGGLIAVSGGYFLASALGLAA
ncbi:MAG: HupE/UreJ family protein [Kiloniellales bacterium]|nr:HupE/UreJ family protein [Kiloniellales bacterium]